MNQTLDESLANLSRNRLSAIATTKKKIGKGEKREAHIVIWKQ